MKELEAEMDAEHRRLADSTNIFYLLHTLLTLHMLHICNLTEGWRTRTIFCLFCILYILYMLHTLHMLYTLHMLHICNRRLADSTKMLRKSERKIKELQFQSEEDQKHQASSILPVQFFHR